MEKYICSLTLLFLSSLSLFAQLGSTGFYRFRNVQNTGDYISMANEKFNYYTIIGKAAGGLSKLLLDKTNAVNRAFEVTGRYLQTDIHMVVDPDCIDLGSIIYAKKRNDDSQSYEYNLIGQGTSLLTLVTGYYDGTVKLTFKNRYIKIEKASGEGAASKYTAEIEIKAEGNPIANLGTRYFVDDNGTFAVNSSNSAENAKWYIEPVEYFNVLPEVEFGGKYYTTMYVPFAFTLGDNVSNAYAITGIGEDGLLEKEMVAANGETVPAGTPVLLECSSNVASECKLIPVDEPLFTAPDATVTDAGAPAASTATNYTGVNLLRGSYYCNQDGNMTFSTPGGTGSFNANNFITPTNPQKYVIGITESGKLGFVKAEGTAMPANKAWLEYAGTEELWLPFEEEAKPGDVTGDGNVDMADALAIVEIILGQAVEGDEHDYNFKAANVNEDEEGKITIADVVALLSKYILLVPSEETTDGPSATFMIDPGI